MVSWAGKQCQVCLALAKILFWERLNKQPNRKELLGVFEKLGSESEVPCSGPDADSGIVRIG